MKKVFIIHGFGGRPNGGWRPWLMKELASKGYYACALAMPNPDTPLQEMWVEEIAHYVDREIDAEIFLVGHSLGAAAILRFLEQRMDRRKIAGIVLVAGPSGPTANENTRNFFTTPFDFDGIRAMVGSCTIIHGDRDEAVPLAHAEELSRGLAAPLVVVEGAGHFNSSSGTYELPECRDALLEMLQ